MISVIVPVYNTGQFLERVITALTAQDLPDEEYELIFIDNGSSDDSLEILARHPEVRTLQEPKRGSYAARNHGVREARGDIIVFTDSDCFPVPGWLSAVCRHFDSNPETQAALGPRLPPSSSRRVRLVSEYENKKAEMVYGSIDPSSYFGYTNNMAVRRAAMLEYGPFVERHRGADTIFVKRLVDALGCQVVDYCPEMAVQHAELESIRIYYSKIMTYAQSRKSHSHIETVRPLSRGERLKIFRETARSSPIIDSVQLFSLLAGGALAWWLGGLGVGQSDV